MPTPTITLPEGQPSSALAILQTVQNRRFSSLAETSVYLKSLSPEERFEIVNGQAARLVAVQEKVDQCMEYLESFVQGDDVFKDRLARDPEVWTKVASGASRARTSAKKKQQALDRCRARWGSENLHHHFGHLLDAGESTWFKVRRVAMRETDIHAAVRRIRDAIFWRVTHGRPGRSADLYPLAADFEKIKDNDLPAADQAAISAAGYVVDGKGWLALADAGRPIREVAGRESRSPMSLPSGVEIEKGLLSSSSPLSSLPSDIDDESEGRGERKERKERNERDGETESKSQVGLAIRAGQLSRGR